MAETEEKENKKNIDNFSGDVECLNISYKYPDKSNYIFEDISFSIKRGRKIVITGKSGYCKSKLMKLLLGLSNLKKGRIFIDNTDLNETNLSSYRKT